jgi:hypothetical protein
MPKSASTTSRVCWIERDVYFRDRLRMVRASQRTTLTLGSADERGA